MYYIFNYKVFKVDSKQNPEPEFDQQARRPLWSPECKSLEDAFRFKVFHEIAEPKSFDNIGAI